MKRRLSPLAITGIRVAGVLGVIGALGYFLHAEFALAKELDRSFQFKQEEVRTRIDQSEKVHHFHKIELPVIGEIEERIAISMPSDVKAFQEAFWEAAESERVELVEFEVDDQKNRRQAPKSRKESSQKDEGPAAMEEISFHCYGEGNYGSILRFLDKLNTSKVLISVQNLSFSRAQNFGQLFTKFRTRAFNPLLGDGQEEPSPDVHAFYLKGRIYVHQDQDEKK